MNLNRRLLMDEVDELLTDTKHPLDEHHTRRLSLLLSRQMFEDLIEIREDLIKIKENQEARRAALDGTIEEIRKDINELWRQFREYPSLTWLLRYKTRPTVLWISGVIVIVVFVFFTYQAWLLARLGFPPVILPTLIP